MNFSHAFSHILMIAGYLTPHFSFNDSKESRAASGLGAVQIGLRSHLSSSQYFFDTGRKEPRINWIMQFCTVVMAHFAYYFRQAFESVTH